MHKKICSKCHTELAIDSFPKDISKKDGLYSSCSDCIRRTRGSIKKISPYRTYLGVAQRKCHKCHKWKEYNKYYRRPISPRSPTGVNNICKDCVLTNIKTPSHREYVRKRAVRERIKILIRYGGNPPKCECCNEKFIEFLAIDHIEGGGNTHRKTFSSGIYRWLAKQKKYVTGFRVLCHNCNMSLGLYKYCPHKKPKSPPNLRITDKEV